MSRELEPTAWESYPMRHSLLILIAILVVGCSWSHKPIQPLEKEAADRALRTAAIHQKHDPARAMELYESALEQYRAQADIEGEMWCLAGIARTSSDSLCVQEAKDAMIQIVLDIEPDLDHIALMPDLEVAFSDGNWQKVVELAAIRNGWPALARLRILAYRIQAETMLGLDAQADVKQAQKLLKGQKRKLHRSGDSHALQIARVHYALAHHFLAVKDYKNSAGQLKAAMELDRLYGDFDALGYDNWLLARLCLAQGKKPLAKSSLLKALRLFEGHANLAMQSQVQRELKSLQQGE